jgi:hypothetical protein
VIHTPYTPYFFDAFMAAHGAIGVMLAALLWWTFRRPSVAGLLLLVAIALATVAPAAGDFARGLGDKTPPHDIIGTVLLSSAALVVPALLLLRRPVLAVVAAVVAWALSEAPRVLADSTLEICALHLVWIGIVLGLLLRRNEADVVSPVPLADPPTARRDDVLLFLFAVVAATIVSIWVLQRADGSADEWAYTFQAYVFAKGHLYAPSPPCEPAFQSFYVFETLGREFSQYTPGWPLFMAPFALFRAPWLAGPVSHGLMAVGVARVTRRIARLDGHGTAARVAASGRVAALVATLGTSLLLLGGSRFSHMMVAAQFMWILEALLVLRDRSTTGPHRVRWAVALGALVAWLGATRPADGALLSSGLFLYALYGLAQRRYGARDVVAALGGLAVVGFVMLLILRIQLGKWFTTGYSLEAVFHPWNIVKYDVPSSREIKYALPLATGSYIFFPCALGVGLAGLLSLRRDATGVMLALFASMTAFEVYYQFLDLNRAHDWGYGPRYISPIVIPVAIGMGIAFGRLAESASRHAQGVSAGAAGGPWAVAAVAMAVTLVRLWPLLYPGIYDHVRRHDAVNARVRELGLHDAIVLTRPGTTGFSSQDLTENLPIMLYPDQDALVAIDTSPGIAQCLRRNFPNRRLYFAGGVTPVVIRPE